MDDNSNKFESGYPPVDVPMDSAKVDEAELLQGWLADLRSGGTHSNIGNMIIGVDAEVPSQGRPAYTNETTIDNLDPGKK